MPLKLFNSEQDGYLVRYILKPSQKAFRYTILRLEVLYRSYEYEPTGLANLILSVFHPICFQDQLWEGH